MGRIRSIKPEFPQSESIGRLSRDARLLFLQLFTVVDDDGRARGASRMLASLLYPYDEDAGVLIDSWLAELEKEKHVRRYNADGHTFLEVLNFRRHQKIDHPTPSKLPPFPEPTTTPREDSRKLAQEGKGSGEEGKGEDHGAQARVTPMKPNPSHSIPDSVDNRILCERVGIFGMREQADMQKLYEAECRARSKDAEEVMEHIVSRWVEYQQIAPSLDWQYGSAYKFFMSGKWDDPRAWPHKKEGRDIYAEYLKTGS